MTVSHNVECHYSSGHTVGGTFLSFKGENALSDVERGRVQWKTHSGLQVELTVSRRLLNAAVITF